jgi:hypothetical protein
LSGNLIVISVGSMIDMSGTTTDPEFWELFGIHTPDWEELGTRERCVAVHADQRGLLAEVISYFLGPRVFTSAGSAWQYCTDVKLIEQEMGSFSQIVRRLAESAQLRFAGRSQEISHGATRLWFAVQS